MNFTEEKSHNDYINLFDGSSSGPSCVVVLLLSWRSVSEVVLFVGRVVLDAHRLDRLPNERYQALYLGRDSRHLS
tara:strand:- start:2253 stop:2477 length:225 start_codon:yes stop_codon:yes gene_type:complete